MSQTLVKRFMKQYPQTMTVQTCMNDLVSEVGELAKEINVSTSWSRESDHVYRPNARKELGQVLFTAYQLAENMGMNADEALLDVIEEFTQRYLKQGHTGSSNYIVVNN